MPYCEYIDERDELCPLDAQYLVSAYDTYAWACTPDLHRVIDAMLSKYGEVTVVSAVDKTDERKGRKC